MSKLKNWFNRTFKKNFRGSSSSSPSGGIKIIRRTDTIPPPRPLNGGRITIGQVHQNPPTTQGVIRGEIPVENPNLGSGIIVAKRRKPVRCPNCATMGCIIENPTGRTKWICTVSECGHTFD